jgi:hypothetical protein
MRYYIRHSKDADVQGPFTVQELAAGINSGRFSANVLASSDIGDSVASLRVCRSCDWFSLAEILELKCIPPPPKAAPLPRRVTVFTISFYVLAGFCSVYSAATQQRISMWLLSLALILGAVDSIFRYIRQGKQKSQLA